jgi:hypothetical protein
MSRQAHSPSHARALTHRRPVVPPKDTPILIPPNVPPKDQTDAIKQPECTSPSLANNTPQSVQRVPLGNYCGPATLSLLCARNGFDKVVHTQQSDESLKSLADYTLGWDAGWYGGQFQVAQGVGRVVRFDVSRILARAQSAVVQSA